MENLKYKEVLQKLRNKFKTENEMFCSKEYKEKYPLLQELYKKEGLKEKRTNYLKNKRKLREIGFNAGFI